MGFGRQKMIKALYAFILLMVSHSCSENLQDYLSKRTKFVETERSQQTGGNIHLNAKEQKANSILMTYKNKEILSGKCNDSFPPSQSFLTAKNAIEQSAVFKILKMMPKGTNFKI